MKPFFQLVTDLEEKVFRAWPPLEEREMDGWRLFFAEGYGRRSNSVQAFFPGRVSLDAKIPLCEEAYAAKGLPVRFKVTPLSEDFGLPGALSARGYVPESETRVDILPALTPSPMPDGFRIAEENTREWQGLYQKWNSISGDRGKTLDKILKKIPARPFFGLLVDGEKAVACASGVLDGDWVGVYEVTVDPDDRRRGFGRRAVEGVLSWAAAQDARRAYLQVVVSNEPALRMYEALGFREAYRYRYYVLPGTNR